MQFQSNNLGGQISGLSHFRLPCLCLVNACLFSAGRQRNAVQFRVRAFGTVGTLADAAMGATAEEGQLLLPFSRLRGARAAGPARHASQVLSRAGRGRPLQTADVAVRQIAGAPRRLSLQAVITGHFMGECPWCTQLLPNEKTNGKVGCIEALEPDCGVIMPFFVFFEGGQWRCSMWSPHDKGEPCVSARLLLFANSQSCILHLMCRRQ